MNQGKQTLLRINVPTGHVLFPHEFRTLIAASNVKSPLLFGRDENEQTLQFPPVRFTGGPGWVGIVAQPTYGHVVLGAIGAVLDSTAKHFDAPLKVQVEEIEIGLRASSTPISYELHQVVLKRRYQALRDLALADLLVRRIPQALKRQADVLGFDCPSDKRLGVFIEEMSPAMGVEIAGGEYAPLIPKVRFSVFADIKGHWYAGNLAARGYGRIIKPFHAFHAGRMRSADDTDVIGFPTGVTA